jgi:IS30 family transposase
VIAVFKGGLKMPRKYKHILLKDRQKIEKMYAAGYAPKEIAEKMSINLANLYRELSRGELEEYNNYGRKAYSAELAQLKFFEALKRRGRKKLTLEEILIKDVSLKNA